MNILSAVLSGLAGTLVMTILMSVAPAMGMPRMDIIRMLGTMFTSSEGSARVLGTIAHFMMGVVFAIAYSFLWSIGIGRASWLWGLIFGAIHAIVVSMMMPIVVNMHPRSPQLESGSRMMVGMLVVHLAYGLVVALTYSALT